MELKVCSDLKLKLELKVRPKLGVGSTAGNHGSLVNRPKVSGVVTFMMMDGPHHTPLQRSKLSSPHCCAPFFITASSFISSFDKLLKLSALLRR